ncbi:MAG TPA: ATP-binding cassette domain-containing protein [Kiritimatiellia bacterium]|nr:ATP-binding cassette domain-containing protein [Kiritimatiellia bacterium]
MIEVNNIARRFGPRIAVDGVTFTAEPGTVLGFLGPNGAGKTTTIRMIAGYLAPDRGAITVMGDNVLANPVAAQRHIGYMPERTPLYEDMSVEGFLSFIADVRGFRGSDKKARIDRALDACILGPVRHQVIETLSKGYRQRTCLAQAILHDPPVLLLDEPTEGLDPNQKKVVRDMIADMARDKVIMISTHVLEEVEAICNRVIIVSEGRIVADNTPDALKQQSPRHHAVEISLAAGPDLAIPAFKALDGVKSVIRLGSESDPLRLRILPHPGHILAPHILAEARRHNWPIADFRTETGRLDDVFRQITTTQDAA